MTDDQLLAGRNVAGLRGDMALDYAGEKVVGNSGDRQATETAMTRPRGGSEGPETYPASGLYRLSRGLFVFGPPALLVAAFRRQALLAPPTTRRVFGVFYILSGLGITAGYHRLFTHRGFKTSPLI